METSSFVRISNAWKNNNEKFSLCFLSVKFFARSSVSLIIDGYVDSIRIHLSFEGEGGGGGEILTWFTWLYSSSSVCFLSLDVVIVAMKCRENDLLLWLTSRCLGLEYRKVAEAKIIIIIKKNNVIKKNKK